MHLNVLRQDFQVAFYYKNLSSPIKINQQALGIRDGKQTFTFPWVNNTEWAKWSEGWILAKEKKFQESSIWFYSTEEQFLFSGKTKSNNASLLHKHAEQKKMIAFNPLKRAITFQGVLPCFTSSSLFTSWRQYRGWYVCSYGLIKNVRLLRRRIQHFMFMSPQKTFFLIWPVNMSYDQYDIAITWSPK